MQCHDPPQPATCRACKMAAGKFAPTPRLKSGERVVPPTVKPVVIPARDPNRFDWSEIPLDDIGPRPEALQERTRPVPKYSNATVMTPVPELPPPPEGPKNVKYTIAMATHDDFDGVYFTIQDLRVHHDMSDVEILVIDNMGCEHTRDFVEGWTGGRYVQCTKFTSTAIRDRVFHEAAGEVVMCLDCHVLLLPGVVARWKDFFTTRKDYLGLLQGPMMLDNLKDMHTHLDPVWRAQMYGTWGTDDRGFGDGEPFDIPMHGLGLFTCRKDAWLGFNKRFRGFGGEEGYIHEKFRQAGRPVQCAPWLRWVHRFWRPYGASYPNNTAGRVRNYLIGHQELGLDPRPVFQHFKEFLSTEELERVARETIGEGPWADYCK